MPSRSLSPRASPRRRRTGVSVLCLLAAAGVAGAEVTLPWLSPLHHEDPAIRSEAVRALGRDADPETVFSLAAALGDGAWTVRMAAVDALARAGEPAVGALLAALGDADPTVRRGAGRALGRMGPAAVPHLLGVLRGGAPAARVEAVAALSAGGGPGEQGAFVRALGDPEPGVRAAAAGALGRLGASGAEGAAAESLVTVLSDPDAAVRNAAAWALGAVGDRRAVAPLLELLRDSEAGVRRSAARSLGLLGDPRAGPALGAALRDPSADVREWAAGALGRLGDPGGVPALLRAVKDPAGPVRVRAAEALGALGDPRAAGQLAGRLGDGDPAVRHAAAAALGQLGEASALEPLLGALGDDAPEVRREACRSLEALGQKPAAGALATALADADPSVRVAAARALGVLGAVEAVPGLETALRDATPAVSAAAADALVALGAPGVPALLGALAAPAPELRARGADALGRAGDGAAVRPLAGRLGDPSPQVREASAQALERLADCRAADPLVASLMDPAAAVRVAGAKALGALGQGAVGAVLAGLKRADPGARALAVEALGRAGEGGLAPLVAALGDADSGFRREARSLLVAPVEEMLDALEPGVLGGPPGTPRTWAELTTVRDEGRRLVLGLQARKGPRHPRMAQALHELSLLESALGRGREAVRLAQRAREIEEYNFSLVLAAGSEAQKQAYAVRLAAGTAATVSLHTLSETPDPEAVRLALQTVLRRKGRGLDALTYALAGLRERLGPEAAVLLDEWTALLAQESSLGLGRGEPAGSGSAEALARFRQRRQELERELRARSGAFWRLSDLPTVEEVQARVPAGGALVEIVAYQPTTWEGRQPERYVAYVLRPSGAPAWVDLGAVAAVDAVVEPLLRALSRPRMRWGGTGRAQAREAFDRLVAPLEPHLGGARHLLVSADGLLHLLPLGALSGPDGHFLVERYAVTYLTTGRDLLRLEERREAANPPLILAGPDFGPGAPRFAPVPAAVAEGRALGGVLSDAELLVGRAATEGALKAARGPRILHVATHGFFLPAGDPSRSGNPLLRSGLALAGANGAPGGGDGEDGVLTALEASALDLSGTQLVVLSACDSGRGEVSNGEGVYGLRRALAVTGAETLVTSLWRVGDRATQGLMDGYYHRLLAGEGRSEALRQVQLEMLASRELAHPFYWASFIPLGDWRPLRGEAAPVVARHP